MLSAEECTAKAADLAMQAESAPTPEWREGLLSLAEQWLELSRQAETRQA